MSTLFRSILWMSFLTGGLIWSGCTSGEAECQSTADCANGERCISAGGVFVSGGRCVPEKGADGHIPSDSGPPTDAPDGDTETDGGDTRAVDTATDDDTEPFDTGADTRTETPDTGRPDTGSAGRDTSAPDCNYKDTSTGVCSKGTLDNDGNCQPPASYSSQESSCGDGRDNDCDGDIDCADTDCNGDACAGADTQCIAGDGKCHEKNCKDGSDNDNDGSADCADADCDGRYCDKGAGAVCQNGNCTEADCGNNDDDDGDGDIDCADPDCDHRKCGDSKCCAPMRPICGPRFC